MMKAPGALRLLIVVAIVATGLGLAAPPAAAVQTLVVSPATGLLDQQVVTVTGTGFDTGRELVVAQCAGALPDGCDLDPAVNTTAAYVTVTRHGTISATLRLSRVLELDGGDVSCADGGCSIVAVARAGSPERARTPIDFEPTGTAPAPPGSTLAISTPAMRANGSQASMWTGSGYLPWYRVVRVAFDQVGVPAGHDGVPISVQDQVGPDEPAAYVAMCTSPPSGWAGCRRHVSPQYPLGSSGTFFRYHDWREVAPDGTVSEQRVLPRMWATRTGRVDCAIEDCSFALEQGSSFAVAEPDAPHSNVVDIAWVPEWSPWPSASAFVADAYPALLGRAATAAERAEVIAGLTDRSITGFGLLRQLAGRDDGRRLAELTRLYLAALGRRPDAAGLLYWAGELRRTGSISAIATAFGRSPEFRNVYGSVSDAQAVDLAYQRTLGRLPASGERAYWVGRLRAGMSRTHMIHLFSRTPEYVGREASRSEATAVTVALLGRSPTADDWYLLGPDVVHYDSLVPSQRADDVVLDVLSDDQLVAAEG